MSEVPEDRLDQDWIDYEGVIGYDQIENNSHFSYIGTYIGFLRNKKRKNA